MSGNDILNPSFGRRRFLRSLGATAGALAFGPTLLSACGAGAKGPALETAVPIEVDPSRPWWLQNNFGPVMEEVEAFDLPVNGALPPELNGLYVRNGSNSVTGESGHWFLADGMLHGVRIEGGRASWYRNRWIETPLWASGTGYAGAGLPSGGNNGSNVSVIHHAGRLLTSGEVGSPYEIDPRDLSTIGVHEFDDRLSSYFTAHPKIDPATGRMHFFGYGFTPPYLTYHVADADGELIHSTQIDLPASSMMHSFAITEKDIVFWDLPVLFGRQGAEGSFPFGWDATNGARVGFLPLGGRGDQIQWLEIEPCYVFHELNAFRDGENIVLDVCRYDRMMAGERFGSTSPRLHRWRISTRAGAPSFRDEELHDTTLEFPMHDHRFTGRQNRHAWFANLRTHPQTIDIGGLVHVDRASGDLRSWDPGPNRHTGEPFFIAGGSGEGEGWLVTYVYDHARDASTFAVFDAQRVEHGPVAEVGLPQRVPFGFHGYWVPDPA